MIPSVIKGKYAWQRAFSALFALFALTGVSPPAPQKTKITRKFIADRCKAVLPEFQMRTDKERPEENTCCIVKGLDAVWAYFCPSKPCLPLSTDGTVI